MVTFLNFIFLIFVFLNILNDCESQKITTPEYNCMTDLRTRISQEIILDPVKNYYDYCSIPGYECLYDSLSGVYRFKTIKLININNAALSADVFSCYTSLETIDVSYFVLETNFIGGGTTNQWSKTLKSLYLTSCTGFKYDIPLFQNITTLQIELGEPATGTVYFSYWKNINNLLIADSSNLRYNSSTIRFINDLQAAKTFDKLSIISTFIPSLVHLTISTLTINYYGLQFEQGSIDNMKEMFDQVTNSITLFAPLNTEPIDFPFIKIKTLYFRSKLKYNTPTTPIDLSQWNCNSIVFESTSNFNFNNSLPISKIPPIISFAFTDGGVSEWPNFSSILSNTRLQKISLVGNNINQIKPWRKLDGIINQFDISNNNMKGTLDTSFCELSLNVFANKLEGSIPSCFTCYFGNDQVLMNGFSNNLFNNYNKTLPCNTIIPNLFYEASIERLWLFGNDLGFGYTNKIIVAGPYNLFWKLEINSHKYYADIPLALIPNILNFTFTASNDNGKIYTLAVQQQTPIVYSISPVFGSSLNQIEILGENFSYNTTIINVEFNNLDQCVVQESTFYKIICSLSSSSSIFGTKLQETTIKVSVNGNSTQSLGACINLCGLGGTCKVNQGIENKGTCDCNSETSCNGNGVCDTTNPGKGCNCLNYFGGNGCFYKQHYVSSVESISVLGGNIKLFGSFSDIHLDLKVFIGVKECSVIFTSSNVIMCNVGSGSGVNSVIVVQNGIKWYDDKMFHYLDDPSIPLSCPNDCTSLSNGQCNTVTGNCLCNKGWLGFNCASKDSPTTTNTTINVITGTTKFNSDLINFDISLLKLHEVDINDEIVESFSLENNWFVNVTTPSTQDTSDNQFNKIYSFNQSLQQESNIIYKLEEISTDKDFEFAGVKFLIKGGSIKTSVTIYNYKFKSSLNTLKLLFKSSVQVINNSNTTCNDELKESEIENISNNQNINYLSIKKGGKILSTRIINRILSDGLPTFITTLINKNNTDPDQVIVSFNLPHCTSQCIIDPDYSVLVSPDFVSNCSNNDNSRKWVIPVAVVVSFVGASIFIVIGFIIYKKKIVSIKVGVAKLKQLNK